MVQRGNNIYKRKDGRWEGRYKKGRKEDGRLRYGYVYGPSYEEVRQLLYQHKLNYQTITQINKECALSYEEWSSAWLSQQQKLIKKSTYETYVYKMNRYILPSLGQQRLNQLSCNELQNMITQWQQQGLKISTIHALYQIVKSSLAEAENQYLVLQNPCQKVWLPPKEKNEKLPLINQ